MVKLTPGMQQYMDIKNKHPDCVIFFRMGDFYETFFEDAKTIARELEITLTSRGKGETQAPLAGIPYHAIEPYLAKLVKKGYKVGIVEQTEDPKLAKGLVKRDLVRIITPGTIVENIILDKGFNNYIVGVGFEDEKLGLSFCDVSTGEFSCCEVSDNEFWSEINRLAPAEIVVPMSKMDSALVNELKEHDYVVSEYDDRFFYVEQAKKCLYEHFGVMNLEGFGVFSDVLIESCGGLISYVKEKQMNPLRHVNKVSIYRINDFMFLDNATVRNLELVRNVISRNDNATLLSVLDETVTPMGKRLLKRWVVSPLIDKIKIDGRLEGVAELKENLILRHGFVEDLKNVYDIERLIGRVSFGNANPKDLVSLGLSLENIPKIKKLLEECNSNILKEFVDIPDLVKAKDLILNAIKNEPNTSVREGNIIRVGYNSELDELRMISRDARTYLAELEDETKERTGIKSLKVRYNKIIGYFIEVTKNNLHLVPEDFIRKQSQVNSERFVTEELKELEVKILGAQEKIYELEYNLFMEIMDDLKEFVVEIQDVSRCIAVIDCLVSFAVVSQEKNYCKPVMNSGYDLKLIGSRHPVIEAFGDVDFINNDCTLNSDNKSMIITGPNMAGKSTYLRQVALCCLMAQMGCFVPASSAELCVVDRVFSRIGAYDDLVNHQSTFMVEMNETANILNNATEKSLVILDEIGRGTSTYDGVSLAWAIAEYLNNEIECKTLFATHYHHLNKLADRFDGVKNFNISVDEQDDRILFLRKIVEGGTDKSYGIQVAKLAGLPDSVISCAKNVMSLIELEDDLGDRISEGRSFEKVDSSELNVEEKKEEVKINVDIDEIKRKVMKELQEKMKIEIEKSVEKGFEDVGDEEEEVEGDGSGSDEGDEDGSGDEGSGDEGERKSWNKLF